MSFYVADVIKVMEEIAPVELALSYDHIGLIIGNPLFTVKSVMVCLDLTESVLDEALEKNCNLIITHHPFIWDPLQTLTEDTSIGRLISKIIRNNLSVYSAHTNFDYANEGVNLTLARILKLKDIKGDEHKFGNLEKEMTRKEFVSYVSEVLGTNQISIIDRQPYRNEHNKVRNVGVSCGAFDGNYGWILDNCLDALVTGELKHNIAIDLMNNWIFTVSAGHYSTEFPGMKHLVNLLQGKIPDLSVILSQKDTNTLIPFNDYIEF